MKPFTEPEMTLKGHSRSSAMSYFIRLPGYFLSETGKVGYYFQTKSRDLECGQGHWAMAQLNSPHITF